MTTVYKILMFFLLFQILVVGSSSKINAEENFETWLSSYKNFASKKGISQKGKCQNRFFPHRLSCHKGKYLNRKYQNRKCKIRI